MDPKYDSLESLIQDDGEADEYFSSLPDYVRDQIMTRSESVNSLESLQDYAENLLRGDG